MKTATILLMIFAAGLLITGCSRTGTTIPSTQSNAPTTDTTGAAASDIVVDTTTTANPDIGTLDNMTVSDELPQ